MISTPGTFAGNQLLPDICGGFARRMDARSQPADGRPVASGHITGTCRLREHGYCRFVSLILVSNRGPVSFELDGSVKRGTGGLVTALTGLASHRDATWIASAMTDGDIAQARLQQG